MSTHQSNGPEMSGAQHADQTVEIDATRFEQLVDRVDELEATVDRQQEQIDELETERERLQGRVSELEADLDERPTVELRGENPLADLFVNGFPLGRTIKTVRERQSKLTELLTGEPATSDRLDFEELVIEHAPVLEATTHIPAMRRLLIGAGHDESPTSVMQGFLKDHGSINAIIARLSDLDADLKSELREYIDRKVGTLQGKHTALIRELADETGVELTEVKTGDKVSRVITDGIDAVENSPTKRQRRAEIVLQNIDDWSTNTHIRAGRCYRLERPEVQRLLNATDDVDITLTSKTTGDVFDAIEQLVEATPRIIKRRHEGGSEALYLGRSTQDSSKDRV